jgi:hypothetical protein
MCTLRGEHIVKEFIGILNDYVEKRYAVGALEAVRA